MHPSNNNNEYTSLAFAAPSPKPAETISELIERNDVVRVENGTLVIDSEQFFSDSASQYTNIEVFGDDRVRVTLLVAPAYPSDKPARHALGEEVHPSLARHVRALALPLMAAPEKGMTLGVDLIVGATLQTIALRPLIELASTPDGRARRP